jgi:hypothetical protein
MPRVHLPDGRIVNFPDGMPEQEIAAAVQSLSQAEPPQGDLGRFGGYKRIGDAVKGAAKHPIETGALIGGAVAAPLTGGASLLPAMAAAGLGGAGGAGLGMIYNALFGEQDSPTTAPGVIKRMGGEGVAQAGVQGGGQLVSKALKAIGTQAYRGALRPSAAIRAKTPNVVEQGIEDGLMVGPRSSAVKAKGLMMQSKSNADQLRATAQAAGAGPVPRAELRKPLMEMARESQNASRLTGIGDDSAAIVERARKLKPSYGLDEAHEAGRILNTRADAAFKAEQRGGVPRGVEANVDQALARAFSGGVKDRVPGMAEANQLTSNRFGLSKALNAAAERPSVLGNIMAGSTGVGTFAQTRDLDSSIGSALAVKGLFSPRSLSAAGIGLDRASAVPFAQAIRAALIAKLSGEEPE